ncbi:hypothetical protein DFP72DRAFT_1172604 [Ephemerocybe angulata]|uniref:Uncharacterized protein n=1 Tax=Ephemerocybe angulata TaxID=980116 RepID=A0A8H6HRA9_9AGAR|nr:hypothetical protein DFP72DRAFT_1172604 [Tulosesus angulatus]
MPKASSSTAKRGKPRGPYRRTWEERIEYLSSFEDCEVVDPNTVKCRRCDIHLALDTRQKAHSAKTGGYYTFNWVKHLRTHTTLNPRRRTRERVSAEQRLRNKRAAGGSRSKANTPAPGSPHADTDATDVIKHKGKGRASSVSLDDDVLVSAGDVPVQRASRAFSRAVSDGSEDMRDMQEIQDSIDDGTSTTRQASEDPLPTVVESDHGQIGPVAASSSNSNLPPRFSFASSRIRHTLSFTQEYDCAKTLMELSQGLTRGV